MVISRWYWTWLWNNMWNTPPVFKSIACTNKESVLTSIQATCFPGVAELTLGSYMAPDAPNGQHLTALSSLNVTAMTLTVTW